MSNQIKLMFLYRKYPPLPSILWSIDMPKNFSYLDSNKEEKKITKEIRRILREEIVKNNTNISANKGVIEKDTDQLETAFKESIKRQNIQEFKSKVTKINNELNQSNTKKLDEIYQRLLTTEFEVKKKLRKNFENILKKAFRVYIQLISIYDGHEDLECNFPNKAFSHQQWKEKIDEIFNNDEKSYKTYKIEDWLKLFEVNKSNWFEDFLLKFSVNIEEKRKEKLKKIIFQLIPFDTFQDKSFKQQGRKTLLNDFRDTLANRGFLEEQEGGKKINKLKKSYLFLKLKLSQIEAELNKGDNFSQPNQESDSFDLFNELFYGDEVLATTSDSLKQKKRFFIKLQHIVNKKNKDKIGNIILQLKEVWEEKEISLIKINYESSSLEKEVELIVYPLYLFYNKRGIYLTGFGSMPDFPSKINYYNYRLDHILSQEEKNKYITILNWDEDNPDIHWQLIEKKEELQSQNSEKLYQQLHKALGVDLHRKIKTMLLRFPKTFHDYYIKESKRHETFEQLNIDKNQQWKKQLKEKFQETKTEIKSEDMQFINDIIEANPDDAYYTMNYRHGEEGGDKVEADVIMRLRAWGYNVEVLLPSDLRKRMREDMKKTWELYQNDQK